MQARQATGSCLAGRLSGRRPPVLHVVGSTGPAYPPNVMWQKTAGRAAGKGRKRVVGQAASLPTEGRKEGEEGRQAASLPAEGGIPRQR